MCNDMILHCYMHIPSLGPALLLLAVGDVPLLLGDVLLFVGVVSLLVGDVPLLLGDVPPLVGGVPLLVGEVSFTRPQDKTNKTRRCKKAFFIIIVDGIRVTKP